MLDAIFYVLRAGGPWRFLLDSFPPWRTVYRWFCELAETGALEAFNHELVQLDQARTGRHPAWATIASIRMLTRRIARLSAH